MAVIILFREASIPAILTQIKIQARVGQALLMIPLMQCPTLKGKRGGKKR